MADKWQFNVSRLVHRIVPDWKIAAATGSIAMKFGPDIRVSLTY